MIALTIQRQYLNSNSSSRAHAAERIGRLAFASIFAATLILSGCARESATQQALRALTPCRLKGVEIEVRCGVLQVPERREPLRDASADKSVATRTIPIRFAVIPSVARNREPDPIFILAGGPGQAATEIAGQVLPLFARLNKNRDLVFIDQRGTGGSHPLVCESAAKRGEKGRLSEALDPAADEARIAACATRLSATSDLTQYTTSAAMQDLDAVRAKLGYKRVNLWGASYGTRAALEYLRQFPDHVRTATLDGVAPAAMKLPLSFAFDTHVAVWRLTDDCAHDAACAKAYPDLSAAIERVFARLDAGPIVATLSHPLNGRIETAKITREVFTTMLRTPLYSSTTASLVPLGVAKLAHDDFSTLAALTMFLSTGLTDQIAIGMHLSVICAEDMADIATADLEAARREAAASAFDGKPNRFVGIFYDQYRRLCAKWPAGRAPQAFFEPVRSDVPVLLLSGGIDPATPPRHAVEVAQTLANVRHLVAPNVGHGVSTAGCAPDLIEKFIRSADPKALDGKCLKDIPRPSFVDAIVEPATVAGTTARLP